MWKIAQWYDKKITVVGVPARAFFFSCPKICTAAMV